MGNRLPSPLALPARTLPRSTAVCLAAAMPACSAAPQHCVRHKQHLPSLSAPQHARPTYPAVEVGKEVVAQHGAAARHLKLHFRRLCKWIVRPSYVRAGTARLPACHVSHEAGSVSSECVGTMAVSRTPANARSHGPRRSATKQPSNRHAPVSRKNSIKSSIFSGTLRAWRQGRARDTAERTGRSAPRARRRRCISTQ